MPVLPLLPIRQTYRPCRENMLTDAPFRNTGCVFSPSTSKNTMRKAALEAYGRRRRRLLTPTGGVRGLPRADPACIGRLWRQYAAARRRP